MGYPSVPITFASQTTFYAGDVNSNLSSILSGITTGSENLGIDNLNATSLNVASTLTIAASASLTKTLAITGNSILTGKLTVNNSTSYKRIGLGTYEANTISSSIITPTKSYVVLSTDTDDTDLATITATNFTDGDLIVITKSPTSPASPVIKDGTGNIQTGADRTLNSNSDKIILQYQDSNWYQIFFSDNG